MKLPWAAGLLALLPHAAWATPVVSNPVGGIATLAQAQHGLLFGGFFTLYSFVVTSPIAPAADSSVVQNLADDVDAMAEAADVPATLPTELAAPALTLPAAATALLPRVPLPGVVDGSGTVIPDANGVPEPSTLLLASLAVLALVAAGGKPGRRRSRYGAR